MLQKSFLAILAIVVILLSVPAFADYETLTGIAAESPEYGQYKSCVDSCGQCESNCKVNTYRMAADMQQKAEFCNYLPEAEKQPCLERVGMAKAIASKNPSGCNAITNELQKGICLLNVHTEKAISVESEAECNSLEANSAANCKQNFYMRMAVLKSDASYCSKITNEDMNTICRSSIGAFPEVTGETTPETIKEEQKDQSKSLIIYGIIILSVIIAAVIAIVIIKKVTRKKPAQAPLMVQQQRFPPLVMQQNKAQGTPPAQQNPPQTLQAGEKI